MRGFNFAACFIAAAALIFVSGAALAGDIHDKVEHGHADSNGVKIHYASIGEGPLIIFIHGFPDYWYSWRHQMEELSSDYRCVAIDQRGYNLSDKPKGVENYDIKFLVDDVKAVVEHLGEEKAIIVGHDWGGFVAWYVAMTYPEMTDKLIICNLPHPRGLARELATNPQQASNSQYARNFQKPGVPEGMSAAAMGGAASGGDPVVAKRYAEALGRSDLEAMLNYYKANYPREPYVEDTSPLVKVKAPVLIFHGLQDFALLPGGLNDTWEWLDSDMTLVTLPGVSHWVQVQAKERVTQTMKMWLQLQKELGEQN